MADGSNQRDGNDTNGADSNGNSSKAAEAGATMELSSVFSTAEEGTIAEDDEDFIVPNTALHTSEQNWHSLTHAYSAAERYGVSNRAAAAVINGLQMDVGRITENDRVFDKVLTMSYCSTCIAYSSRAVYMTYVVSRNKQIGILA